MTDVRKLLAQLAAEEEQLYETEFLAPCVAGGKVRAAVAQLVQTFAPNPADFEGWGIFRVEGDGNADLTVRVATVVDEPSLPQLTEYLQLLKPLRLRLAYSLRGQTWLAYPLNESDMEQRFGSPRPVPVYLAAEGGPFEPIIARFDGGAFWFEACDRRADPQPTEQLAEQLRQETLPERLNFAGMTPEMRVTYELAWQQTPAGRQRQQHRRGARSRLRRRRRRRQRQEQPLGNRDERQLRDALRQGGGELQEFRDRGDYWQIEWTTADGDRHTSAIEKGDLTVISSGICLSGRDRDFDLQSLVGVIEQQEW